MNSSATPIWETPSVFPALDSHEIHVWTLDLAKVPCHSQWLSVVEQDRYTGITSSVSRQRFCTSRCALRFVLAGYLGHNHPAEIAIELAKGGKPFLAAGELHFNLSHSRDRLLLAVSQTIELGVDLEYPRPVKDVHRIARRLLTADETTLLQQQGFPEALFFQYWTRHEARQKCSGNGLFGGHSRSAMIHTHSFTCGEAHASIAWKATKDLPRFRYLSGLPSL